MNKERKIIIRTIIYFLSYISSIIYIIFRFIAIPNPKKYGISSLLLGIFNLLLEIWEFFNFTMYFFNVLVQEKSSPKIPNVEIKEYPDIDVLIATYNEEEILLEKTIKACKEIDYPDKKKLHIYICDDGNRDSIRKLTEQLNINYISRNNNKDYKAGNYNNALSQVKSPFIACFDADMCPTKNFLKTTLPFFFENPEEKIGFVQLPQSFITPDIFQYRFKLWNELPIEQDYFYHVIQIAKNSSNSVIFCGTNTLFNRKALDDVNGFSKGTISEDFATGMNIESKGYKCIAINNIEAYGVNVDDIIGMIKQRSRWARGCIQILKTKNIFKIEGLTFQQKLEYISCISYWFFGVKRILSLIFPVIYPLFGIHIVICKPTIFLIFFLPQYIFKRFILDITEGHLRSSTWDKIYQTIIGPIIGKEVLKELFGYGSTKFEVTDKNKKNNNFDELNKSLIYTNFTFFSLNVCAIVHCIYEIFNDKYDKLPFLNTVYIVCIQQCLSNVFYLTISIIFLFHYENQDYSDFIPNNNEIYHYSLLPKIFYRRIYSKVKEA
jgi:cellulose synthase (UDP-forming)